ncbi:RNA 2'-phosphotransferase [Alloalcanivorax gelatiniphagus]
MSKRLSYVLRHRPDSVGLSLGEHGWVAVDDLLHALSASGTRLTRDDLRRVVSTNDKQRFELDPSGDRIRARQGHSVEVDLALEPAVPPDVLFHGTPERNLPSIRATGLDRRQRHHVHLSPDTETAQRVGSRRGAAAVLTIDAAAMSAAGATFWCTGNDVWLTDHVGPEFISVHLAG